MAGNHKRKKKDQEGFFNKHGKSVKGKHKSGYGRACKSGYMGGKHEAHHILPQTSIEKSCEQYPKQKDFIEDVKWITPWSINNSDNLIGLPTFAAYLRYFHKSQTKWEDVTSAWFYAVTKLKVKPKLSGPSPEQHPIHQPVSWGHTEYNVDVAQMLMSEVWDPLSKKRKVHEEVAQQVADTLNILQEHWRGELKSRAATATKAKWESRTWGGRGVRWYVPFTMADCPNPIDGR